MPLSTRYIFNHIHAYLLHGYVYFVFVQTRDPQVDSSHYLMYFEPYNSISSEKFALALTSPEGHKYYVLPQGEGDTASLVLSNNDDVDKYIFKFQKVATP